MLFSLTEVSGNTKTGPISVAKSSSNTCPPSCGMFYDCYGKFHYLKKYWGMLDAGEGKTLTFDELLITIRKKVQGIWRYGEVGDLPGVGNKIDREKLRSLTKANKGKQGFAYTHKPVFAGNFRVKGKPGQVKKGKISHDLSQNNRIAIKEANKNGFVINLSCDSLEEVDQKASLNIGPVVTVLPMDAEDGVKYTTPNGIKIVTCPAARKDLKEHEITCKSCKLYAILDRKAPIGFPAHGSAKKRITKRLKVINNGL